MAKDEKIPVVGVSETEPAGANYQQWMTSQLDALDKALCRRGAVSALSFDRVSIKLAGRTILADVSFAVEEKEFIGMLGANGGARRR